MYSADPVQPRPNPIWDAVPTPRPTPYLWTGLGWTNFRGSISGRAPTHPLCVSIRPTMPPPRLRGLPCRTRPTWLHAGLSEPERPPHLPCRLVIQNHQATQDHEHQMADPKYPSPSPTGRTTRTRGERR